MADRPPALPIPARCRPGAPWADELIADDVRVLGGLAWPRTLCPLTGTGIRNLGAMAEAAQARARAVRAVGV